MEDKKTVIDIIYLTSRPNISLELISLQTVFTDALVKAEIEDFARARFAEGVNVIFIGHFHMQYHYRNRDAKVLRLLPDWFSTQKVTIYDRDTKEIKSIHWEEVGV